ncbi:hypothetical protein H1C71_015512 [Ictidomys tridecemlineatus]|nr:hypothetical protein H1C71_015512 [Ictidomys tridecemlineatus]
MALSLSFLTQANLPLAPSQVYEFQRSFYLKPTPSQGRGFLFLSLPSLFWPNLNLLSPDLSIPATDCRSLGGRVYLQSNRWGNQAPAPAQLTAQQKLWASAPSSCFLGTREEDLFKMTREVQATPMLTLLMSRTPAVGLPPFQIPLH